MLHVYELHCHLCSENGPDPNIVPEYIILLYTEVVSGVAQSKLGIDEAGQWNTETSLAGLIILHSNSHYTC